MTNCNCSGPCTCGISTKGTGSQSIGVSRRAVTRIAPDESQGHAGGWQGSSAHAADEFAGSACAAAPGVIDHWMSFGEGFKKPRA